MSDSKIEEVSEEAVTLLTVINAVEALNPLMDEKQSVKKAARLFRLFKYLLPMYEQFGKFKDKLVEKYGTVKDGKTTFEPKDEKEVNRLLEKEVKREVFIPDSLKFSSQELEGVSLTGRDLSRLEPFISDFDALFESSSAPSEKK